MVTYGEVLGRIARGRVVTIRIFKLKKRLKRMEILSRLFCCGSGAAMASYVSPSTELAISPPVVCPAPNPQDSFDISTTRSSTAPVRSFVVNNIFPTSFRKDSRRSLPALDHPEPDDEDLKRSTAEYFGNLLMRREPEAALPWKSATRASGIPIRNSGSCKHADLAKKILKEQIASSANRDSTQAPAADRVSDADSSKRTLQTSRKSTQKADLLPCRARRGRNPKLEIPHGHSVRHTKENSEVVPSARSTFKFTPTYFNPEIAREYKFDADLATALAQSSVRKGARSGAATARDPSICV